MTQLSCSFGRVSCGLSNSICQLFIRSRKSLFEIVYIVYDLQSNTACQLFQINLCIQSDFDFCFNHLSNFINELALMVFVEVILLPQTLLNPSDLPTKWSLLLFSLPLLVLQLIQNISKLILHGSMKRANALLLPQQLVPDKGIHCIVFGFILHFLAHLFLGDDPLSEV